jgi:hypothetical protein
MTRANQTALLLFIVIFCCATGQSSAEVYQWTDDSGKTVFGDNPPKNKQATPIDIQNTEKSGTRFATPNQVKSIERQTAQPSPQKHESKKTVDAHCRRYISDLNKVEIFLEHSNSPRDQHRANDLRKLIEKECSAEQLAKKFDDWRCKRYRQDLNKTEIFLEHTNNPRDQRKAEDLRKQIARECK